MANYSGKRGHPKKMEIDWKEVNEMCKIQCTGEEIAGVLGIDYDTLLAHIKEKGYESFSDYLKKYGATGRMSLRRRQYKAAVEDGNTAMQIWLGKQYLGQREKQDVSLGKINDADKLKFEW